MHSEETRALFALVERIGKICHREAACEGEKNAGMAAFGLLFQLRLEENIPRVRMSDVSRYMMISKPAATQAVNRLVEKGLVERVNDESDRRVVYIQPTEAGRRLFDEELDKRLSFMDRVLERMGVQEAAMLTRLLDRFFYAIAAESEEK